MNTIKNLDGIIENNLSFLIENSLRIGILNETEFKNTSKVDAEKRIEIINRIALSIPFDYSNLLQSFNAKLSDRQDAYDKKIVFDALYEAIKTEPLKVMDKFMFNGTGATCLAGSIISSAIFRKFGYETDLCIATKDNAMYKDMIHFILVVNHDNKRYYVDNSLNLIKPIDLDIGQNIDESIFHTELVKNQDNIDVFLDSDKVRKYLWSFKPDEKEHDLNELSYLMASFLDPSKRPNPRQYLRLNTLVSGMDISTIVPNNNGIYDNQVFRLRITHDETHEGYFLTLVNKNHIFTKKYAVSHNSADFNSINIAKTSELREDIKRIAGIRIDASFFEDLNSLNKKLSSYKR